MAGVGDHGMDGELDRMAASVAAAAAKVPLRRRSASLDVSEDERRGSGNEGDNEGSRKSRKDSMKAGTSRRSMSYQGRQASVNASNSRGSSPEIRGVERGDVVEGEGATGALGSAQRSLLGAVNAVKAAKAFAGGKMSEAKGFAAPAGQGLPRKGAAEVVRVAMSLMGGDVDRSVRDGADEMTEGLRVMSLEDVGVGDSGERLKRKLSTIDDESDNAEGTPRSRSRQDRDEVVFEARGGGQGVASGLVWDDFDVPERDRGVLREFGEEVERWQDNFEQLAGRLEVSEQGLEDASVREQALLVQLQYKEDIIQEQGDEIRELRDANGKNVKAIDNAMYWSQRAAELEQQCSELQDELHLAEAEKDDMSAEYRQMKAAKVGEVETLRDELERVKVRQSSEVKANEGMSRAVSRMSLSVRNMSSLNERRMSTSTLGAGDGERVW